MELLDAGQIFISRSKSQHRVVPVDGRADVAPRRVTPHMLRRAFARRWLMASGSEVDLMRMAGWHDRGMIAR